MLTKIKTGENTEPRERYVAGKGGRKTAVARTRIYPGKPGITVNDRDYREYFREAKDQAKVVASFEVAAVNDRMGASVRVAGSGIHAQADAVRNSIAKALVAWNAELRKKLRGAGYLTRDARAVERKKYGLKKARRAPQWQKR